MLNLNEREWLPFYLKDICDIESGCDIYDAERMPGSTPYITSSAVNNGVKYFVGNNNETLESNCISVNRNGSVGYCFYHKYPALYSNDCRKLRLKKYNNEYVALFITNQVMQQKDKYNYSIKMGTGRLKKQKIMLPVDNLSDPDYPFMEQYIKERKSQLIQKYKDFIDKNIQSGGGEPISKFSKWGEFFLTDIFTEIKRGKRLKRENHLAGNMPYISASALSNGVDNFVANAEKVRMYSNCLTLANSGSVGICYYHPYSFIASDHITSLFNPEFNKYHYLFLSVMLCRFSEKYNFNREINDSRILREKVLLPIDDLGIPDYTLMEQYGKQIMLQKYQQYIDYISV